jgi:protein O-GlcNAc transferase
MSSPAMSSHAQQVFSDAFSALNKRDLHKAEKKFRQVIKLEPSHIPALNLLTVVLMSLRRFEEAEPFIAKAVKLNQTSDVSFYNYGLILKQLNKPKLAYEQFSRALQLNSTVAETWNNRGTICNDLGDYRSAIADFSKAIEMNLNYAEAHANKGKSLLLLRRYDEAIAAYEKALSIKPDLAEAWLGRGNVFTDLKRCDGAIAAYEKALSIKPDLAEAWLGRGNVFTNLKRYDEAFVAYDKALSIKPDLVSVEGARLHTKMHLCRWDNLDEEIKNLSVSIRSGKANTVPFALLSLSDSSEDHLLCSQAWVSATHPPQAKSLWQGKIYKHDKIRIGYVSADLHKHATAYLMAELFELHDRSRFSIKAFSLGPDDNSDIRRRLVGAFDQFVDCRTLSDDQVAKAIIETEVDILVDLKGLTQDARTNIFSYRPAPIQVNYIGYPGTMGASYIDYIVGDKTLFNLAESDRYTEKMVQTPYSYQPNDRKRQISSKVFTRQECGLPESGFVFCCFNNNYKILPSIFRSWMRILNSIEASVIWLLAEDPTAIENLRNQAQVAGVDPSRLVFASRMDLPEHLARHQLADLFLDTLPYNAHTTASDALWAGLPVLTQIVNSFAGRVAASLLNAVGLPELITHSAEEYEALAIELALNPGKLKAIRGKLARNRLTMPLFDTPLYTKHLEVAYEAMYQRYQAGLPPDHIEVTPIK